MTAGAWEYEPDWPRLSERMQTAVQRTSLQAVDALNELLLAARDALNAAEAGVLAPSRDGFLRFVTAANSSPQITQTLLQLEVAADRSIAGYVYSTGQPLAYVHDPQQTAADGPRHDPSVDQATGLVTRIYLALPIMHRDQILGVLTFVNRRQGPFDAPFTPAEMQWGHGFGAMAGSLLQFQKRLQLLAGWAAGELADHARQMAAPHSVLPPSFGLDGPSQELQSPLARVLYQLEELPSSGQNLVADLLEVLARHLGDREQSGS